MTMALALGCVAVGAAGVGSRGGAAEPVPDARGAPGAVAAPDASGAPGAVAALDASGVAGATGAVPVVGGAWPVGARPWVVRGWEPPATKYGAGHRGVDLAAPPGSPVRAAAAGRVAFAGRVAGRGVVSVELSRTGDPPLRTTYEPVRATITEGDRVATGEPLGTLEPAARFHCPTACLHWGLLRRHTYLDPLTLLPPHLLGGTPPRLLPMTA
ncbi:peptidoglycan DD-metalloendopeptidase family protein [Streptomyces silvensis]|uniref:peptidoglycan DD-metalloendopeptidase family protein n=1 Tax=Streptomyces silvensis TaxID=1765722 RepID=UPI003D67C6DC